MPPITTRSADGPPERCYTTAPVDYDWGWTTVLIDHVAEDERGRPVRLVEVADPWHYDYQVGRYGSGCHAAWTEEEYQKQVQAGFYKPTPDKAIHYFRKDIDVDAAMYDEAMNKALRPYVYEARKNKDNYSFSCLGGTHIYRLTVKGPKDEAEAKFNRLVQKIEAILNPITA